MRRLLRDLRLYNNGKFAVSQGFCVGDVPSIAGAANSCIQRLILEGDQYGWWGGWAKVVFYVSRTAPYITVPYQFSRIIGMDMCRFPIRVQNEFYEVLEDGIGLRGPNTGFCGPKEAYDRGVFPTMVDLTGTNQILRVYLSDPTDVGKNIYIQNATDQNGNGIYSQVNGQNINGFLMQFASPFVDSPFGVNSFGAVYKDVTNGDIILKQVDPTTGTETTLSRYTPNETGPAYRRYFLSDIPWSCCEPPNLPPIPGIVAVTCMAKYEFTPVSGDLDPLIVSNLEALIEEGQALQFSTMESPQALTNEAKHHRRAINLLQKELTHYTGARDQPAVNWSPFGTASLCRAGVGTLI